MKQGIKFEMYKIEGFEPIEIRFDKNSSIFFCEFSNNKFKEKDLNDLKNAVFEESKELLKIVWTPVILIGFDSYFNKENPYRLDLKLLGTKNYPNGEVKQILSSVGVDFNMDRSNAKNWYPINPGHDWDGDTDGEKIINYNSEKYNTLKFILKRFNELREELRKIIQGDNIEHFIENISKQNNFIQLEYNQNNKTVVDDG